MLGCPLQGGFSAGLAVAWVTAVVQAKCSVHLPIRISPREPRPATSVLKSEVITHKVTVVPDSTKPNVWNEVCAATTRPRHWLTLSCELEKVPSLWLHTASGKKMKQTKPLCV